MKIESKKRRILSRLLAKDLTPEELAMVSGGINTASGSHSFWGLDTDDYDEPPEI